VVLSSPYAHRPRVHCALVGAAYVWLPPLTALVLSPLHECSHCVKTFAVCYLLAPGVWAGLLTGPLGSGSDAVLLLAVPATLLLWWAASAATGVHATHLRRLLLGTVALLSGASSVVFGHLLRM